MLDSASLILTRILSNIDRLGHPELPQDAETVAVSGLEREVNGGLEGQSKSTSNGNEAPETYLQSRKLFNSLDKAIQSNSTSNKISCDETPISVPL